MSTKKISKYLQTRTGICGFWVNIEDNIFLIIERVKGKYRAIHFVPDADIENRINCYPIIERDYKFYFDTEIGEIPFTYHHKSDTLKTQYKYERVSNHLPLLLANLQNLPE